jgi:hypothetical protein
MLAAPRRLASGHGQPLADPGVGLGAGRRCAGLQIAAAWRVLQHGSERPPLGGAQILESGWMRASCFLGFGGCLGRLRIFVCASDVLGFLFRALIRLAWRRLAPPGGLCGLTFRVWRRLWLPPAAAACGCRLWLPPSGPTGSAWGDWMLRVPSGLPRCQSRPAALGDPRHVAGWQHDHSGQRPLPLPRGALPTEPGGQGVRRLPGDHGQSHIHHVPVLPALQELRLPRLWLRGRRHRGHRCAPAISRVGSCTTTVPATALCRLQTQHAYMASKVAYIAKLVSANIDSEGIVAQRKYIMSQVGPLSINGAFLVHQSSRS